MKVFEFLGAALLSASIATGIEFNPDDEQSIKDVTRQYSYGLMELYKNNASGTSPQDIGIFPKPYYWWEAGAAWDTSVLYSMFTGDTSHVKTVQQALTSNYGPANDFILDYRRDQTGNDDQAFWAQAVMSALEYQFPEPENAPASYLQVVENAFNNIVGRWDEGSCGGGLKWQIYKENSYGYTYKNSISNGCAFALGARLARYTGNKTYAETATKIYDWTKKVGLITDKFEVFDGADDKTDCKKIDETQWSYNNAMFLHGAGFMYDVTNGDSVWKDRISGFLKHAETLFFTPFQNSTDIMYEWACETGESGRHCNLDQQSFKAYLARYMAATAAVAPFTKDTVEKYLRTSAIGAAKSCSGPGNACGSRWYAGSFDGQTGVGQQLSALEVTQSLLMLKKGIIPAKKDAAKPEPSPSAAPKPSSTPAASSKPAPSSQAPTPAPAVSSAGYSQAPAPASSNAVASSKVPLPAVSNIVQTSGAPAPSANQPSAAPKPSAVTQPGGQFGEAKPSSTPCSKSGTSCSCTPSVTTTVYVKPSTLTTCTPSVTTTVYVNPPSLTSAPPAPPAIPINSTTSRAPFVPANSTVPTPSKPLEFQGAATNNMVVGSSVFGAVLMALVAGLM